MSRIFGGFIVAFWAVMMVALFRAEYAQKSVPLEYVARERLLQKIFANTEPSNLNVLYQGRRIGTCRIDISPVTDEQGTGRLHRVQTELSLQTTVAGAPQRMRLTGDSIVGEQYRVEGFRCRATLGEDQVEMRGNAQSRNVTLIVNAGGVHEQREVDLNQGLGGGLAGVLGLAGLGGLSVPASSGGEPQFEATILVDPLKIGEVVLRTYLVHVQAGELIWGKLWVSELGEILRIETSLGLTMESVIFDLAGEVGTERAP